MMSYVDGFLLAVPTANRETYIQHAKMAGEKFSEWGALELYECWGDDVPDGKVNSMKTAVMAKEDETVVFSWVIWPSKEVRDEAMQKMFSDEEMADWEMPFDGSRMIFGGFVPVMDEKWQS